MSEPLPVQLCMGYPQDLLARACSVMFHASTASWQEHASVQRDVYRLSVAGCQLRLWSGVYNLWYRLEVLLQTPGVLRPAIVSR